jgi:SpoVK/Ycf46/Vps4 family AAA+-type ATPase
VLELNGPLRILNPVHVNLLRDAWIAWRSGKEQDLAVLASLTDPRQARQREILEAEFRRTLADATGQPTVALELLRQLTIMARTTAPNGRPFLPEQLLIIIESVDMLVPAGQGDLAALNQADRHRVAILQDWFTEPGFMDGPSSVVMIAESASSVHPRVAHAASVLRIEVPSPDADAREHYISWFMQSRVNFAGSQAIATRASNKPVPKLWAGPRELANITASLSIQALRQLLTANAHSGVTLEPASVIPMVERFIATELGEDVVEFKKPVHTMNDVIGFANLKQFLADELIPRFTMQGDGALPGAAVAGPIGSGKTYIFEAVASSLDLPVLVLKNIRSQWYGQTDVIFEKLRRTLEALGKVIIFVDEADTQFGGVGADAHETERRLTGKVQQMMSDPRLRGKVIWLLMTARIHLLSPDIRRPGRVGDLIIPVLDPQGADREAFLAWTIRKLLAPAPTPEQIHELAQLTSDYSAAAYSALRSALKAHAAQNATRGQGETLTFEQCKQRIADILQPAIGPTRRYQTLQAMLNCTRRSLLPDPTVTDEQRLAWEREIRMLEATGVR